MQGKPLTVGVVLRIVVDWKVLVIENVGTFVAFLNRKGDVLLVSLCC